MYNLCNKRILVGISGSIAAYKGAELVRQLKCHGAAVKVVMTRSACEFITPLTLQSLSGEAVHSQLLDTDAESLISHIELARWADAIIIAPASANLIARLSHGIADELLTTLCLATSSPLYIAPAMNRQMWQNPLTQHNVDTLRRHGITVLEPATGEQACGENGPGRMLDPAFLAHLLHDHFNAGPLQGAYVLITAGPTREPIDPVRFISNRSSGHMGYAIAEAAIEAGANTTLISGPVAIAAPDRAHKIEVITANEMHMAVIDNINKAEIFISAAAVADYQCAIVADQKIKKKGQTLSLDLQQTPDILADIAKMDRRPYIVGFAAETDRLKERAKQKLMRKKLDMIVANQVGWGQGFDAEENKFILLWKDKERELDRMSKPKAARQLIQIIAEHYHLARADKKNARRNYSWPKRSV